MAETDEKQKEQKIQSLIGFTTNERIGLGALLVFIVFSPLIFTQFYSGISFIGSGEIGDTIGGITAPFVNLFAAYLVYKSFTAQIRANAQQREDHTEQMEQLKREHRFTYITNLFNLVKDDYYQNNRIEKKSNLGYIYHRMISIESQASFCSTNKYSPSSTPYDLDFMKSEINNRIRDPLQILKSQLTNMVVLTEEIKKSKLDRGIKHFYQNEIEKILFDMDLWILLNPAFTKRMEDLEIFGGFLSNSSGYSHSKVYAEAISKMGYNIRTQLDG
ncbi:hypothetical protein [Ulvibacterium sp.]|uniref:hypothetical protein n=1 Tax=Ulvibacterium sp. TaxID=2665914 RepID=UPI0026149D5F|nr:hypothetical protein [Ulvibacterium sp.]